MLKFTVPGNPVAKGRPRFATRGKSVIAYTPKSTKTAETSVTEYAKYHMGLAKPLSGPVAVDITFYMPIPQSKSKAARERLNGSWHISKPDKDNLEKLLLDALNGIVWVDDSQVCQSASRKIYSLEPRTEITITILET